MSGTRQIDQPLTIFAQKMPLIAKLQALGEHVEGWESMDYLLRAAACHGLDGEEYIDRKINIYWN